MGSGHDSLSKRQSVLFSFKEISLKEGITADNADSHEIDSSSEMTVSSFRDSACSFKLAGLKDRRVNTNVSDKRLMRREVINIAYLDKESGSCRISDTVNGTNDLHLFCSDRLAEFKEDAGDSIQLLHKVKESSDLLREDQFLSETIESDRVFCGSDNIISADCDLSASTAALKGICNNLSFSGSNKTGRRELFKEQKHSSCEDITDGLQFRESSLQNPLNLVFSGIDQIGDRFSLSGNIPEISGVLRGRELLDGILLDKAAPP